MTPVAKSEITAYPSPMLVYDGSCGFCNRSVQFILRHERQHDLSFVTRNSELGKGLRRTHRLESVESMLWIEGGQAFAESGLSPIRKFWRIEAALFFTAGDAREPKKQPPATVFATAQF